MDVRIVGGGRCSEPVELIGAVSRSSGNGEEAMRHLGGRLDWTGMGDGGWEEEEVEEESEES